MPFFATEKLGPKQAVTPDGYLLCEEVPIARLGEQLYTAAELPTLTVGSDLVIRVKRVEEDVFRPETMASFEGKPATMGHPEEFVTPLTWNDLAVGHAQNVRRGDGLDSDLLVADLLITNAEAIAAVRAGLREVSCGYDATYEQAGEGVYFQRNIIGNHIALVERGRAGTRCSIKDEGTEIMKTPAAKPASLIGRLIHALRTKDEAALMDTLQSMDDDDESEEDKKKREEKEKADRVKTGDELTAQVAALTKTVDALAGAVRKMTKDENLGATKPAGTEDEDESEEEKKKREEKEKDERVKTGDALRDTVSKAEIITPGFSMPTRDSVTSVQGVTALQRRVLADAMKTEDGKKAIAPLLSGRTVDALSDDAIAATFNAAAVIIGAANSARGVRSQVSTKDFGMAPKRPDELNAVYSDFWKDRGV